MSFLDQLFHTPRRVSVNGVTKWVSSVLLSDVVTMWSPEELVFGFDAADVFPGARVLDAVFRDDWGLKDVRWFHSGDGGAYAWILDRDVRGLSEESKNQLLSAMTYDLTAKLYPTKALARARDILTPPTMEQGERLQALRERYPRVRLLHESAPLPLTRNRTTGRTLSSFDPHSS